MNYHDSIVAHIRLSFFYGKENISGDVKNINRKIMPFRKIKLFHQETNSFIESRTSDLEGEFSFNNFDLNKGPFFLVVHDPTGEHNAVIADNIGGPNYVDN